MALPQAGVELVASGLAGFTNDMGRANQAVADFGTSGSRSGSDFDKGFSQIVIGGLREMGANAIDVLGKAAQAVGGFAKDSIGLAGDFQQGMREFQVAAGKDIDAKGLQQFHDLFLQLGKDLPVSTSEVEQAAIELVKGGIDPATVAAGGLKQSIQFAAAAMKGDLAGAATISSKIVAGWAEVGATAADKANLLTHATDLLTKAANASSTDVGQLSQGLFNAQGIAKTAGVSLDDLTTTIGELAGDFSSSAEAGTSLKNFIARLQPTTDPATDAMKALGLYTDEAGSAFYDAQGNFVGFQQASQLLQDSLKGLTKEQQAATLQQIFGNDAMSAAAGLAARGGEGYTAFAAALDNANGVQAAAAIQQATFNTSLTNAAGSVEALQIKLGEKLLPILGMLVDDYVTPAINSLSDLTDAVFGNEDAFNRLSPAAQAVVSVIKVLVDDMQHIIGAFDDAGASSSDFASTIGYLADDLGLPGDLIADIVFAVQDLVGWFGKAGDESDKLGSVVNDLSGIWQKAIGVVQNVGAGYQAIIQSVLPIVAKFIAEHGTEISAFFKTAYDQIIRIVNLALDLYNAIVPPILKAIAGYISAHASEIETILGGAWDVISGVVKAALDLIEGTIKIALDLIHGDWSKAWTDLQTMSAKFVTDIGQAIKGGLDIIAGFFGSSLADISKTWQNNWDQMWEIASKLIDRMPEIGRDIVDGIERGIENAWGGFLSWLEGKVSSIVDSFLKWIGAGSPAKEFMPIGQFATQGIMEGFRDWWPSLMNLVSGLGDDLIEQATNIGNQIQQAIGNAFGATASIDRQVAANLDKFKDILPQYQQYTTGALQAAEQQARGFLDPQEGAKFFQMRSKQILEYAKLQKDLNDAATQDDRKRIEQQMLLINAAQTAEISQFNANLDATKSGTEQLMGNIQTLLGAQGVNARGQPQGLPGILENPAIAGIFSLLQNLMNPANPWANPPASAQQIYGSGMQSSYSYSNTVNMPVYTNQSPAVIQDSAAIAWASMP